MVRMRGEKGIRIKLKAGQNVFTADRLYACLSVYLDASIQK